jgi:hypothetical protein
MQVPCAVQDRATTAGRAVRLRAIVLWDQRVDQADQVADDLVEVQIDPDV